MSTMAIQGGADEQLLVPPNLERYIVYATTSHVELFNHECPLRVEMWGRVSGPQMDTR